ncbi:CRISPR-associated endonuclease Cas2 [Fusibacter sp. 3D3]|uniref:CRISPR-associated endonuclease Cas2 n=1 Tax=Fusibacter sp. 3D3 TaxID=1048380 RepID=UPI00085325B5|nr:CRISPR-associated endonuclease Cas2 [Fusibacter sp. 3D3]GAU78637.1 hypothetical protein F3D3_3272 [Fusibacter sp. 3D3]
MNLKQDYIVCYDIINDTGRRKIEKIISHYGHRIQYSVFECKITSEESKEMLIRLKKEFEKDLFAINKDTILIFTMCESCSKKMKTIGKKVEDYQRFMVL